jgi:hypothetical protein
MSVHDGEREVRIFKPYPQYKNSTADWIGRVPAHWNRQADQTGRAVEIGPHSKPPRSTFERDFQLLLNS